MSFLKKILDLFKPKVIAANPGAIKRSRADLHRAILALNADDKPWIVTEGGPEKADLVAEWKMDDRDWGGIFQAAKVQQSVKILMRFDETAGEVRSIDLTRTVKTGFGLGSISYESDTSRGQNMVMHFGTNSTDFTNPITGSIGRYSFQINEVKKPLQNVVTAHGWGWRGLIAGAL